MAELLDIAAGKSILFLMATPHEYGKALRKFFEPSIIGVGPVEAGINTASILQSLNCENHLPNLVVCLGSAGSATLAQTEVYQVSKVSYRDMDASALGFEKGCTPFLDLPPVIELPLIIPGIPSASLSTGANIINGKTYNEIDAQMADMETYAVLRACQKFNIPLIGLRGISDGREELRQFEDWTRYLDVVDEKLAIAVDKILSTLKDKTLEL